MQISIIVAMDEKRGIGKENKLMWHIPGELPRFKLITTGHPIIMGRKTFESIGRSLPNRTNIIITRDESYQVLGGFVVHSLQDAIDLAKKSKGLEEIFIIGGGQIFEQALPIVDKLYLTIVKGDFSADVFFPEYSQFTKVISEESHEDGGYKYTFLELQKE